MTDTLLVNGGKLDSAGTRMTSSEKPKIMKLSIVILCWNDLKVIRDCLASIYAETREIEFETIVCDNGSTDGSIEAIRREFPQVRLIENGKNLRFAKGNNAGIEASRGEYVLILNPDTIMHDGALGKMVAYADRHPEGGAFGCKVVFADGAFQRCMRPLPTPRAEWFAALRLGWLARVGEWLHAGEYTGWNGENERTVGWLAGCFILTRGELLKKVGGFDPQFFYYFEDTDLCQKIWRAGYKVLYTPEATITHLLGQSTNKRFKPLGFALDGQVTRYLYFYKYYGAKGVRSCHRATLTGLMLRRAGYALMQMVVPNTERKHRQEVLRALYEWNCRVDPVRLAEYGEEPALDAKPMDRVIER
ncbi:MAG: glycosyltransferase family 2 protein [Candidatus Acidiferrales bacterium]